MFDFCILISNANECSVEPVIFPALRAMAKPQAGIRARQREQNLAAQARALEVFCLFRHQSFSINRKGFSAHFSAWWMPMQGVRLIFHGFTFSPLSSIQSLLARLAGFPLNLLSNFERLRQLLRPV